MWGSEEIRKCWLLGEIRQKEHGINAQMGMLDLIQPAKQGYI